MIKHHSLLGIKSSMSIGPSIRMQIIEQENNNLTTDSTDVADYSMNSGAGLEIAGLNGLPV